MYFKHTTRPGFLLGLIDFCTAGLFFLLYMQLGVPTLFIYTLVWMARISEELKAKAIEMGIEEPHTSWRHMFGWNVFGSAVATHRFFNTLNKIEIELNKQETKIG